MYNPGADIAMGVSMFMIVIVLPLVIGRIIGEMLRPNPEKNQETKDRSTNMDLVPSKFSPLYPMNSYLDNYPLSESNPLSILSTENPQLGYKAILHKINKTSYVDTHSLSPEIRDIAVSMIHKHPSPRQTTIRRGIRRVGFFGKEEVTIINVD